MPLDQKAIDKLKKIHLEEYGEELTNQEAWDMGIRLINLFKTLVRRPKSCDSDGLDNLTEN
jgi:hypothetical protein